jgi:hypothetical protein
LRLNSAKVESPGPGLFTLSGAGEAGCEAFSAPDEPLAKFPQALKLSTFTSFKPVWVDGSLTSTLAACGEHVQKNG